VFNTEAPAAERKAELLKKLGLKRPFIMHHGTIQPRKNLVRLIAAYRLLLARNPNADFDLALPGPMGWKYDEIVAAAQGQTGMRGRVLLTGAVGTEELAVLLKSAALMVVPSLYEGFCMPMVEAMACGTPVIASSTSCLPEISGKQLLYFDPTSVEEMAVAMEKALFDSDVRTGLQERGPKRAAAFSWERCAAETLSVLLRGGKEGLRA
jgi:glycosyltransferase involved in cell wall biosynthesis